ncbi:hypothetical protein ACVWY0_003185 [Arthrobacter sp. UYNi723]
MGFITAGYDGTVDEVQFAEILHRYSVVGPDDFKATTQAGDRIVAISDGVALGPGTRDVATAIPNIQFAAASGTRWDLVVLQRDWQPPGGASSITIVQGGPAKGYPPVGTAATNWNRRPGILDDQPLYLQEVNGTLLGQRVDLRCWASNGGLFAKDELARTYLDRAGTEVCVNGTVWRSQVGANGIQEWVKASEIGKIPLFGYGGALASTPDAGTQFLVQAGSQVNDSDGSGYARLTFPKPFPNGLLSVVLTNGDQSVDRAVNRGTITLSVTGLPWNTGTKDDVVYTVAVPTGQLASQRHRVDWIAIGW